MDIRSVLPPAVFCCISFASSSSVACDPRPNDSTCPFSWSVVSTTNADVAVNNNNGFASVSSKINSEAYVFTQTSFTDLSETKDSFASVQVVGPKGWAVPYTINAWMYIELNGSAPDLGSFSGSIQGGINDPFPSETAMSHVVEADDPGELANDLQWYDLQDPAVSTKTRWKTFDQTYISGGGNNSYHLVGFGSLYGIYGIQGTLAVNGSILQIPLSLQTIAEAHGFPLSPAESSVKGTVIVTAVLEDPAAVAVPEPRTYALMLAGLGPLGLLARRKRYQSD